MSLAERSPLQKGSYEPVTWNFKLIGQHALDGFGGMGEGMSIQIAPDGRRILWLAHESAPKNFTARRRLRSAQAEGRGARPTCRRAHMRSNSLETCGNLMAVAYQTQKKGLEPAGLELFDISVPEKPKSISFFDCSGPTFARRAPALVLRRRIRPLRLGLARLRADPSAATTSSTAASTCAIPRSRSSSAAGGCPAPARATTSCRRRATRSTRATAPTTATSIRSVRTAAISPISTAACTSSTFPTRRTRRRSRPGPTRRPTRASCTRSCRCSTAG